MIDDLKDLWEGFRAIYIQIPLFFKDLFIVTKVYPLYLELQKRIMKWFYPFHFLSVNTKIGFYLEFYKINSDVFNMPEIPTLSLFFNDFLTNINFFGVIDIECTNPYGPITDSIIGYFLLKFNWDSFSVYCDVIFKKYHKNVWVLFTLLLTILYSYIVILYLYRNNTLRIIIFNLCWFFLLYWLLSIFIFLFKKAQYSSFTRIIQRFWKRSLYLFWVLELFLFSIYLFLTLIAPQEYLHVDMVNNYYNYNFNMFNFFITMFIVVILLFLLNISLLLHKYNAYKAVLRFIILFIFFQILQEDFMQFFYVNQYYNNTVCKLYLYQDKHVSDTFLWNIEVGKLKRRTIWHYFFILNFLKFWHTAFIVGFFLFFEFFYLNTRYTSYNVLAATIQNCYFLLGFTFILKIIFLKTYLNSIYEYTYYWFFVNNHFFDFNMCYHLFNTNQFFFYIYDIFFFFLNLYF